MGIGKKILVTILSIISLVAVGVDVWYVYILKYAPQKVISQTFEVGEQVVFKEDGSVEKKHFIDINIYDNVYEIQFNYMLDENQTAFFSQGIQYVLKNGSDKLDFKGEYTKVLKSSNKWTTEADHTTGWFSKKIYHNQNRVLGNKEYKNITRYDYMSGDSFETTSISTNPINSDTMFKIQLGDDLYGMKLRYDDIDFKLDKNDLYIGSETEHAYNKVYFVKTDYHYNTYYNYKAYDIEYFLEVLFNAVSNDVIPSGTDKTMVFEFGDFFNYYKYDEEKGQYSDEKVKTDELSKISSDIKNYYCIGVRVNEGNLNSSDDSLFNCYAGNSNYNLDNSLNNYFIGRNIVTVDIDKFDFIETDISGVYNLKLNDNFIAYYKDYIGIVELDIIIDLDYLSSLNLSYGGVVKDSLKGFKIHSETTIQTVDGELVKGGINYV